MAKLADHNSLTFAFVCMLVYKLPPAQVMKSKEQRFLLISQICLLYIIVNNVVLYEYNT